LSRLECHAGSMTQTNGWRNADYCYCHAKQNPGRLWRDARAYGLEFGKALFPRFESTARRGSDISKVDMIQGLPAHHVQHPATARRMGGMQAAGDDFANGVTAGRRGKKRVMPGGVS